MPNVECKICGKSFYAKPRHLKIGWGKYCSKVCQNESQRTGIFISCKNCGKKAWRMQNQLKRSQSKDYFCNKSCQAVWRNKIYVAELHNNWVNGIRSYRNIIKRSKILQVCTDCGLIDKRVLIVHHIDHNRTNNSINNLMWLCRNCHYLIHEGKTF